MSEIIKILEKIGVYCEHSMGKWCYKHQNPGQPVVIISDEDKEKAAAKFFIDLLKSIHYSCRRLYEENRHEELKKFIQKYQAFDDPNINKTIEIVTRDMKFKTE